MARRNVLADLIGEKLPAGNPDVPAAEPAQPAAPSVPFQGSMSHRGAIGAISRSIAGLTNAASDAEALRSQLASGQAIVEIAADLLDPSPIADRLDHAGEGDLVESIRGSGQQVPILVRPHPTAQGRYQIAYGHRRARALKTLGRPVRAVVRPLSDSELVVAQGQENNARRDLSYIERALYAAKLEEAGYDRQTIMAALAVDKTGLSKLISSTVKVPRDVIEAIGPAPAYGRNRWVALAGRFDSDREAVFLARGVIGSPDFAQVDSDARFEIIEKALQQPRPAGPAAETRILRAADGSHLGRLEQSGKGGRLNLSDPAFAQFLATRIESLHREFSASRDDGGRRMSVRRL